MAGTLTKGVKLSYGASSTYTDLTNLQSFPDLGGSKDSVEVTTMDDSAHTYIPGLESYGDSLSFVFLYEKTQFSTLSALSGTQNWKLTLPDSSTITWSGRCDVTLTGSGVNAAMQYTLKIFPESAMSFS